MIVAKAECCSECNVDKSISTNFATMLQKNKYSDIIFMVQGEEFKLHRNILSARSPVFEVMFESNFEESKQNRVTITDIEVDVFEELIKFIYTGKIDQLDNLVHELFVVADKYQIESLKNICHDHLINNLTIQSAIQTLMLADLYRDTSLRSKALNFVVRSNKEIKTKVPINWSQLETQPHLLIEILNILE